MDLITRGAYIQAQHLLGDKRLQLWRERLVQQRNGDRIARQDDVRGPLMRHQLLDGCGHVAGEVNTAVLHPSLIVLVVEPARVALARVKLVVCWPGYLVEKTPAGHEQARGVRIHEGDHTGLVLVDQACKLEEIGQWLQRDEVVERDTGLKRLEELVAVAGKDGHPFKVWLGVFVEKALDARRIGPEVIQGWPAR